MKAYIKRHFSQLYCAIVKPVIHRYFYCTIKFIWFVTENKIGYIFYCCTVSGLFSEEKDFWYACSVLFVFFTVSQVIELFLLVKFPPSPRSLDKLLGKEFIILHLGKHTTSAALIKVFVPLVLASAAHEGSKYLEHQRNLESARSYNAGINDTNAKYGFTPSHEQALEQA